MQKIHAKSPCCRAKLRRFGRRRRQCSQCFSTWRIRKKRRGRKQIRISYDFILAYLQKRVSSLRDLALRRCCGKDHLQVLLRRSLTKYVKDLSPKWSTAIEGMEPLIAIADAIWYRLQGEKHTIYVILLRPVSSNKAVICPPIILCGHEDRAGWNEAFACLPASLKNRVVALVCDGGSGLIWFAHDHHWIIQRCHFHLIAAVQNYLTTGPRSMNLDYAQSVLKLVQSLLRTADPSKVRALLHKLERIRKQSHSRGLRRVLGGLITNHVDFHAYLNYLKYNLPTTSNAAESCIQCFRDLMYRARGFRSQSALILWLTALALFKKTIHCNGKKSTKLNH